MNDESGMRVGANTRHGQGSAGVTAGWGRRSRAHSGVYGVVRARALAALGCAVLTLGASGCAREAGADTPERARSEGQSEVAGTGGEQPPERRKPTRPTVLPTPVKPAGTTGEGGSGAGGGGGGASAEGEPPAGNTGGPAKAEAVTVDLAKLPAPVRLGVRAESERQKLGVLGIVVVVSDPVSFVEAVSRWKPEARYPVLWDDGTWQSREDISRFVHAFKPTRVVRWSIAEENPARKWPKGDIASQRKLIEAATASAWGATDIAGMISGRRERFGPPAGIVAMNMQHPCWPGGLALAAGHGQPIAWAEFYQGVNAEMGTADCDRISTQIEDAARASGLSFDALGDDIDAVAVCLNAPSRVRRNDQPVPAQNQSVVAMTDMVGRKRDADRGTRWAWAAQLFGNESLSAYRAMSALFIQPSRAWMFHGYEDKPGFRDWDPKQAEVMLPQAGMEVMVDRLPGNSAARFRMQAAKPAWARGTGKTDAAADGAGESGADGFGLDAGLVCVNTMGNADFFQLNPGRCVPGDLPILSSPAVVHFVHSWSAFLPEDRGTVAGRFLEHGAYAYVGSVFEPGLGAFQPVDWFVKRMLAPAPLAAAARHDKAPVWKVTIIGDPLLTFGPPAKRVEAELPLKGAADQSEAMKAALRAKKFGEAAEAMRLLHDDETIVRVARSLLKDEPKSLTPEVAGAALPAAFRRGDLELVQELSGVLENEYTRVAPLRDYIWHALRPAMPVLTEEQLMLLRAAFRAEQPQGDGPDLHELFRRAKGLPAADGMLAGMKQGLDQKQLQKLNEGMSTPR